MVEMEQEFSKSKDGKEFYKANPRLEAGGEELTT
jgi:hypothetical protein